MSKFYNPFDTGAFHKMIQQTMKAAKPRKQRTMNIHLETETIIYVKKKLLHRLVNKKNINRPQVLILQHLCQYNPTVNPVTVTMSVAEQEMTN